MNSWQIEKQLEYLLKKRRWANDAAKKLVFAPGSVLIAPDPLVAFETIGKEEIFPAVCISNTGHDTDPEAKQDPELVLWRFNVRLATANANDQYGRAALMGAAKNVEGLASSRGRGLDELLSEVSVTLEALSPTTGGITVLAVPLDGTGAMVDQGRIWAAYRDFNLEVWGTRSLYYHPPENLYKTGSTSVVVHWSLPPDRHDLFELVLCRVAGSTPTTDPTVGVVDSWDIPYSGLPSLKADTPGAGTWSWSLFAGYDDLREAPSEVTSWSAPATLTVTF